MIKKMSRCPISRALEQAIDQSFAMVALVSAGALGIPLGSRGVVLCFLQKEYNNHFQ